MPDRDDVDDVSAHEEVHRIPRLRQEHAANLVRPMSQVDSGCQRCVGELIECCLELVIEQIRRARAIREPQC
jgi:hypothetical protein